MVEDTVTEEKSEEIDDKDLEPPDGGYGWFVVLGSFLSHVLIGGLERSDGIFFLLFQSQFDKSAALTAWPGAVASMLRLAMGPIASAICQRWSVRACCMVGGFALGCVQILSALSPNFYVLFFSHGFLQGIARGLLYCPSLILVNMYFEKRRSLATGLAASGVGVGTLVVVPLLQFLFDTYGFLGGFLVLGAICFNGMMMAMLYRPLFLHYKFTGQKGCVMEKPTPSETLMLSEMTDAADTASLRSVRLRSTHSLHHDDRPTAAKELLQHSLTVKPSTDIEHKIISSETLTIPSDLKEKDGCLTSSLKLLFPRENVHKQTGNEKGEKPKLFHFKLLRNPAFFGFCLSIGIFTATFKSTFTFIPALATSRGLTNTEAVLILSLSGVVDTIGRVMAGFILDRPAVRKRRLAVYSFIQFFIAGLCALMPFVGSNFAWLATTCSLFGMLTGLVVSQKSVLCVDLLNAKLMPSAFGILLLFQAGGTGVGPLLAGACRDFFGRFHEAFFLGAGLMAVSACLMVYSTIVHSVRKRNGEPINPSC
ncbi:monocarboxylate transporter [Elysia marginata]|uniref:Monocarboxylate transporter n=1 Tax=Elysia marginata TaxID=1093978 RepID=A0AAV4FUI1_9GAST|nr:monocarboxylate transporter [Elysia marginata]